MKPYLCTGHSSAGAVLYYPANAERFLSVGRAEQGGEEENQSDSFRHSTHEYLMLSANPEFFN